MPPIRLFRPTGMAALALFAACCASALPQAAAAATVSVSGGTVFYRAASNELNYVRVSHQGLKVRIEHVTVGGVTPPGISIPGSGCARVNSNSRVIDCGDSLVLPSLVDMTLRAGDDQLLSVSGIRVKVDGGDGSDLLSSGPLGDTLIGGNGVDRLSYADRGGPVRVTAGSGSDDGLTGEGDDVAADVEQITATPFADYLVLGSVANTIAAGAGDDVVDGGTGTDAIDGGDGVDTVDYSGRSTAVAVTLAGGADDGASGERDSLTGFENVAAGAGNDRLTGTDGANVLTGGGGTDVLDGGLGADRLDGGAAADGVLYTSRTAPIAVDLVAGAGGESGEGDLLTGIESAAGGSAADTLIGDDAPNWLEGGAGDDVLRTGAADDVLIGGDGADELDSGAGADIVRGGLGADVLAGGADDDDLDGGDEDDSVIGGDGGDKLAGGAGADAIEGGDGADTLDAGDGNDRVAAGAGDDAATAGAGDDLLAGQARRQRG